jgi:RNA 3'-terminal phosphate cyclase (ATP)
VAGFSALGRRGKRAEAVAGEAASEFLAYHASGACLEPHLADQLALYMGLARGVSRFTVSALTSHLRTNLAVVEKFLPVRHEVDASRNMVAVHG